jgi:lipoate-protein ligase A
MALDEALLEAFAGSPVLRLYRWRPEAISLGRFQRLADLGHVPAAIPRVRRITGGGAIHHREDELTYSIVAPYAALGGRRSPRLAYRAVHEAIARGLASLGVALAPDPASARAPASEPGGPALCYDRATDFDLKAGARKLVGSAQRRKGDGFLQHGSIPCSRDPFSPGAISLEELLGHVPAPLAVARAVTEGIEAALGIGLELSSPTGDELARARRLEAERYASAAWTEDGR